MPTFGLIVQSELKSGKVPEKLAIRIRDDLPRAALQPDRVLGIDQVMRGVIGRSAWVFFPPEALAFA
jgi:hypothetical protein